MYKQKNYAAVNKEIVDAHWKENTALVGSLLLIWFVVTWLAAIFSTSLNKIGILGFPLGYATGAMLALFIYAGMIFYYAYRMDRIDEKHGMQE
ncbi:MAG TPA: DUF4212 domain-containing protein [Firmicutes bacterium]|nr:DUF4212 domain-containing protein [Bacillota bacterium]